MDCSNRKKLEEKNKRLVAACNSFIKWMDKNYNDDQELEEATLQTVNELIHDALDFNKQ